MSSFGARARWYCTSVADHFILKLLAQIELAQRAYHNVPDELQSKQTILIVKHGRACIFARSISETALAELALTHH